MGWLFFVWLVDLVWLFFHCWQAPHCRTAFQTENGNGRFLSRSLGSPLLFSPIFLGLGEVLYTEGCGKGLWMLYFCCLCQSLSALADRGSTSHGPFQREERVLIFLDFPWSFSQLSVGVTPRQRSSFCCQDPHSAALQSTWCAPSENSCLWGCNWQLFTSLLPCCCFLEHFSGAQFCWYYLLQHC